VGLEMCEVGFYKQGETLLRTCVFSSKMSLLQGMMFFEKATFVHRERAVLALSSKQITSAEKHHALQQLYDLIVREIERSN